jgi:hypothetical protein
MLRWGFPTALLAGPRNGACIWREAAWPTRVLSSPHGNWGDAVAEPGGAACLICLLLLLPLRPKLPIGNCPNACTRFSPVLHDVRGAISIVSSTIELLAQEICIL